MKGSIFVLSWILAAGLVPAAPQAPPLQKGVSVEMAPTRHALAMPGADRPGAWIVAVTARGSVYFGVDPVSPGELREKVKAALAGHTGTSLYLKGDARVPYGSVRTVLAAAREAGIEAPNLLTSQRDSPEPGYPVPPKGLGVLIGRSVPAASESIVIQALPGEQQLALSVNHERASLETLPTKLAKLLAGGNRKLVVLKADEGLKYGDVVRVIDACRSAGAKVFLAEAGLPSGSPIAGTWSGTLNGLPAAILTVAEAGERLHGTINFPLQIKEGDHWRLAGDSKAEVVQPELTAGVLRFQVLRPSDRKLVPFELKLSGDGEATLENLEEAGPNAVPPLKMVRGK